MDEAGSDGEECSRKGASGGRVAGAIRSLVNTRDMQLDSCMKHCFYLFVCMPVRQCYGKRRRDLE